MKGSPFPELFYIYSIYWFNAPSMKLAGCFFIYCISAVHCFSQSQDTYQPSALYKQNKVKARMMMFNYSPYQTRAVDYFNPDGLLVKHIDFDTVRGRYFRSTLFEYDSMQKLTGGMIYLYTRYDKTKNEFTPVDVPDTLLLKIDYFPMNRGMRKKEVTTAGKIVYEATYDFDPITRKEKFFHPDSSTRETVIDYEIPNVAKKEIITIQLPDGQTQICTFTYKNAFDKTGKIKSRKTQRKCNCPGGEDDKPYYRECDYHYMSNGLLINRISSGRTDDGKWKSGQLFDYKFW